MSVSNAFSATAKAAVQSHVDAWLSAMNTQMAPSVVMGNAFSGAGDIRFAPAAISNAIPPVTRNINSYAHVTWSGCTVDLTELTSLPGRWQACDFATVAVDYDDIAAYAGPSSGGTLFQRTKQLVGQTILASIGLGSDTRNTLNNSFRLPTLDTSVSNQSPFIKFDEACMLKNFKPKGTTYIAFGASGC